MLALLKRAGISQCSKGMALHRFRESSSPQMDPFRASARSRRARWTSGCNTCRWRRCWRRSHKRRMPTQELIRHVLLLCGGKSASEQGSSWKDGDTATRCASEGGEGERKGRRADGDNKLSAPSQRSECVSGPPISRSERETVLRR